MESVISLLFIRCQFVLQYKPRPSQHPMHAIKHFLYLDIYSLQYIHLDIYSLSLQYIQQRVQSMKVKTIQYIVYTHRDTITEQKKL